MKDLDIQMPETDEKDSGICSPKWMRKNGILVLSQNQLKNIAKKLNEQAIAESKTRDEIVKDVLTAKDDNDDMNVDPEVNKKNLEQLKKEQAAALEEKKRLFKEWEEKQKK